MAEVEEGAPKPDTVSREWTYVSSPAWQPSVPRTARGMAVQFDKVGPVEPEGRVLSTLLIFRQQSELWVSCSSTEILGSVYQARTDFLSCCSRGTTAITSNPNRLRGRIRSCGETICKSP